MSMMPGRAPELFRPGFSYIAVEGPIGVGKTTLARRLAASLGGKTLLEAPQDNPFLERFYQDPPAHALATQLSFLLQRAEQMRVLGQRDLFAPVQVTDFMLDKDRLFAELTLSGDELALYDQVFDQLIVQAPAPDLVIYLQAPVDVLLERIARRAIPYEARIDAQYLERLNGAYTRFFHCFEAAPLVIINAAQINLAESDDDYNALFEQLKTIGEGRHYLDPLPF